MSVLYNFLSSLHNYYPLKNLNHSMTFMTFWLKKHLLEVLTSNKVICVLNTECSELAPTIRGLRMNGPQGGVLVSLFFTRLLILFVLPVFCYLPWQGAHIFRDFCWWGEQGGDGDTSVLRALFVLTSFKQGRGVGVGGRWLSLRETGH